MQPITDVFRLFRYQRAIRSFTDEAVLDELLHSTRAHVIAWRKDFERRRLPP
jgi:hypothetical protein